MKKFLAFLVFCLAFSIQASIPTMTALGQGANGSYYLSDARNMFFNPTNMFGDYLNMESEGQAVWVSEDMGLALGNSFLGKDVIQGFYSVNEMLAVSPYFNMLNGEGVTIYGANVGVAYGDLRAAGGGTVLKGKFLPSVNAQFKTMDAILYADYTKLVSKYSLLVGVGMDSKNYFTSVEFGKVAGNRDLKLTLGGTFAVSEGLHLMGSVQQYVFFDTFTVLGLGASWNVAKDLALDMSTDFKAFGLNSPKYGDFGPKLALTYNL